MKVLAVTILVVLALAVAAMPASAQTGTPQQLQVNGTPHGVELTWTAAPQGSDPDAIVGYFAFRCHGTSTGSSPSCTTTTGTWTQLTPTPNAALSYLDPAANNFTLGDAYTYAVQTVDAKGKVSTWSNLSTVTVPSTGFPLNPGPPVLTATVQ